MSYKQAGRKDFGSIMKCKTCPEELTIIKPDGFSMRICERCRFGCEVKKASGQTCFPIKTKEVK